MRGQLHAMETILVAIVLSLLLFFGIYVFNQIADEEFSVEQRSYATQNVERVAQTLAILPETSCPLEGGETRICIDLLKLEILSEKLRDPNVPSNTRLYFVEVFGPSEIVVEQVYPQPPSPTAYVLFNATDSDELQAQTLPVNLYDPVTNRMYLGKVTVRQ